jgi:hypothetical protein
MRVRSITQISGDGTAPLQFLHSRLLPSSSVSLSRVSRALAYVHGGAPAARTPTAGGARRPARPPAALADPRPMELTHPRAALACRRLLRARPPERRSHTGRGSPARGSHARGRRPVLLLEIQIHRGE